MRIFVLLTFAGDEGHDMRMRAELQRLDWSRLPLPCPVFTTTIEAVDGLAAWRLAHVTADLASQRAGLDAKPIIRWTRHRRRGRSRWAQTLV